MTLNDTLEQRIAERTEAVQMLHDIATMANQSQDTEQAIEYCLRRVAMHNGCCFGHALLPNTDNADELVPAYAYYDEDPKRVCRFREVSFGLRLRRGQGLPGRVLALSGCGGRRTRDHDLQLYAGRIIGNGCQGVQVYERDMRDLLSYQGRGERSSDIGCDVGQCGDVAQLRRMP